MFGRANPNPLPISSGIAYQVLVIQGGGREGVRESQRMWARLAELATSRALTAAPRFYNFLSQDSLMFPGARHGCELGEWGLLRSARRQASAHDRKQSIWFLAAQKLAACRRANHSAKWPFLILMKQPHRLRAEKHGVGGVGRLHRPDADEHRSTRLLRASNSAVCFIRSRRNCRDQEPRQDANLPVVQAVPFH
jgi:hypothetical protein